MPLVGLSSSYYAFQKYSIYDAVKRINELGFSTAELGAAHTFEKDIWKSLRKIRHDFPKMNFTVHGMFPPLKEKHWLNLALGLNAFNKKIISGMFKAAEISEAKCVTMHPGFLSEALFGNEHNGMDYGKQGAPIEKQKAFKGVCDSIDFSLKLAKKTGVNFGVENITLGGFTPAVYSVSEFRDLFSRFPKLGWLFDMGHALSEARLEELLSLKEKAIQMHVHFSRQKSETVPMDEHKPLPSEKEISFMRGIKQIKKIPLIFEHGTNVSETEILAEKKLLEGFLKKI